MSYDSSIFRSRLRVLKIRLLIVPNGNPIFSAISLYLYPAIYILKGSRNSSENPSNASLISFTA